MSKNPRNTIYNRGMYWCTRCQVKVSEDETYKSPTGLGGAVKHKTCGASVRTRRRWKRKETPRVLPHVLEVDDE